MLIMKNPPKRVAVRARCMLNQYRQGLIKPRRTCRMGFLSLCVTREWRLLSKDEGVSWHLLSHSDYDKQL